MHYIFNFTLIILLLLFYSCREKALNDPNLGLFEEEKIYVEGTFTNGGGTNILLKNTVAPFSSVDRSFYIDNAMPIIIQNGTPRDTCIYQGDGMYYSNYSIEEDKSYQIEIQSQDYPTLLSQTDAVPTRVSIQNTSFSYNEDSSVITIRGAFEDPPSVGNYYALEFNHYFNNERKKMLPLKRNNSDFSQLRYPCSRELLGTLGYLFKDDCFNGQKIDFSFDFDTEMFIVDSTTNFMPVFYPVEEAQIILRHISPTLYDYEQTRYSQDLSDPFSEPAFLPSNVEGGYGMMAGQATDTLTITIE